MNIIGIVGQKNSGKSTVAKMIAELTPGTVEVQLAAPMKRFCADVFDWKDDVLNGPSELREKPDERYPRGIYEIDYDAERRVVTRPIYLTPRFALQHLGTDWGRACYKDVWIDYALREAKKRLQLEGMYHTVDVGGYDCVVDPAASLVIIPDVRFVNEARKIHAVGGQVWRVRRPAGTFFRRVKEVVGMTDGHASEREQFSPEMDKHIGVEIINDGSLDKLHGLVEHALNVTK